MWRPWIRPSAHPGGIGDRPGGGVSRRDIAWRQDALRAAPRRFRLPGWVDAVLLVALVGYLLAGLALAPMTLEEAVQDSLTADAGVLVTHPGELLPGSSLE